MVTQIPGITIAFANNTHVQKILMLHRKWHQDNLDGELSNGFVSGAILEQSDIDWIITRCDIVVAIENSTDIVGYYLAFSANSGLTEKNIPIINRLQCNGILPTSNRFAGRCQVVIDKKFQGTTLRRTLFDFFILNVAIKYDFIFSRIVKANVKSFYANLKDGWRVVAEDVDNYYVAVTSQNYGR